MDKKKHLSLFEKTKIEFTKLFVYFRTPMKKSFVVFYEILQCVQFITIAAQIDGELPLDYERLSPMWNFVNYV
jgi:hypothetical protein